MSEHVLGSEIGGRRGMSSLSKMTGQGEGIYGSTASADVGLQQTDQIGLTLFPKTNSRVKLSLDTCAITDQDFEDALKQLEPLLAEAEGKTSSSCVDASYGSRRCYNAPSVKRRKLPGDLYEPSFQKVSSSPVIWPISLKLNMVLPEPVSVCAKNPYHDDANEDFCFKPSQIPLSSSSGSREVTEACREKDAGKVPPPTRKKIEPIEETCPEPIAFEGGRHAPTDSRKIISAGSDDVVLKKELKAKARTTLDGQVSEVSSNGPVQEELVDVTSFRQHKDLWDHDLPVESIESIEMEDLSVGCTTNKHWSRSSSFDMIAMCGVPVGFSSSVRQTIAGVTGVAANETTRIYDTSQDSLQFSRESLQTSTLVSLAKLFLQNSPQASVKSYWKSLSAHQIPAELRQRFHVVLRKFQSDEKFQKAAIAYAMELSGAVPPDESDPVLLPPRLRQAFDAIYRKCHTEEGFRASLDKFVIEFLKEKMSPEKNSSGAREPDHIPREDLQPKDLNGLSVEQLTRYCRQLEYSRALHAQNAVTAKAYAKRLAPLQEGKQRLRHNPVERCPKRGFWTCFHPQTTRKGNKDEPCGRSNPYYEKRVVWQEITRCKSCKNPYKEDFEQQKLETPRKKYYKPKQNADEPATHVARSSPGSAEVNDFSKLPLTQQEPLFDAPSGQMYAHLNEDRQIDARHSAHSCHSSMDGRQHTILSDTVHSTSMDDAFLDSNYNAVHSYPMQSPAFQSLDIENTDSIGVSMDFNAHDGEFDELAMDSDQLFTEMATDSDLQHAESFLEQTRIFEEDFLQFAFSPDQDAGHYPAQVNLFPQNMSSSVQSCTPLGALHPSPPTGNANYGAGFVSTSSSIQPHEQSKSWAAAQFDHSQKTYVSPYLSNTYSGLAESVIPTEERPAGTLSSLQLLSGVSMDPAAEALPHMPTSMPLSQPDNMMTRMGPAIVVTDTDSGNPSPYPWPSKRVKNPSPMPRSRRVSNGRGQGWKAASSPTKKKRGPPKTPRLSRSKAAVAERAALAERASLTEAAKPERPLTQSQLNNIRSTNKTSAILLGGPRKSWEEPLKENPSRVVIEILDDNAEMQEEQEEMEEDREWEAELEAELEAEFEDDAFTAALNAEFDRHDRAAANKATEESEISEEE